MRDCKTVSNSDVAIWVRSRAGGELNAACCNSRTLVMSNLRVSWTRDTFSLEDATRDGAQYQDRAISEQHTPENLATIESGAAYHMRRTLSGQPLHATAGNIGKSNRPSVERQSAPRDIGLSKLVQHTRAPKLKHLTSRPIESESRGSRSAGHMKS
jgi:hypothetical protein